MSNIVVKDEERTSYDWATDPMYAAFTQIEINSEGWPQPFEESFYKEKITRKEFEKRILNSLTEWDPAYT